MGSERLIRRIRLQLLPCLHESPHGTVLFARNLSYKDIKKATDGFHRIIYENSRGTAYKARFQDGGIALVKEVRYSSQENDVFYREVQLLARLHHRHLLPLKGFSAGNKRFDAYYFVSSSLNKALSTVKSKKYDLGTEAGGQFRAGRDQLKLLIFDNIEYGSLREHLSDPLRTPLNWTTRLQIASGVVAALEYLLVFSDLPILHVSITSSSIMLDENFTAKLSDITFLSSGGNNVTETHTSSSEESAVQEPGNVILQLGVLILELITGQCSEEGGTDLVQWIQGSRLASSMHQMIDPDLGNGYNLCELKNLLGVAKLCIKSGDKPTFSVPQILHFLQKKLDVLRD